jgi:peptidoglycan/LPS O-acetylase OafA/YrhL
MTAAKKHAFHALDALRGVAALAVVIFHFGRMLPIMSGTHPWFASGFLAVDLFFLLSGFVIAYAYEGRLRSGLRAGQFFKLRLIRLLPMIWIGVLLGVAQAAAHGEGSPAQIAGSLAFNLLALPSLTSWYQNLYPLNAVEWSLTAELLANLIYAVLFPWLRTRVLVAWTILSAMFVVITAFAFGTLNVGYFVENSLGGLARVSFSFPLGVILFRTRERWKGLVPSLHPAASLAALMLILTMPFPDAYRMHFDLVFALIVSPVLVMLLSENEVSSTFVPLAAALGTISYPLYATHFPLHGILEAVNERMHIHTARIAALVIVGCILLAWLLAVTYEPRVRSFLASRFPARPRAGVQ